MVYLAILAYMYAGENTFCSWGGGREGGRESRKEGGGRKGEREGRIQLSISFLLQVHVLTSCTLLSHFVMASNKR